MRSPGGQWIWQAEPHARIAPRFARSEPQEWVLAYAPHPTLHLCHTAVVIQATSTVNSRLAQATLRVPPEQVQL
jgi:hypothetical protein